MSVFSIEKETPKTQGSPNQKPRTDSLTVTAISATAISLTVALHEAVHGLACVIVGGEDGRIAITVPEEMTG